MDLIETLRRWQQVFATGTQIRERLEQFQSVAVELLVAVAAARVAAAGAFYWTIVFR